MLQNDKLKAAGIVAGAARAGVRRASHAYYAGLAGGTLLLLNAMPVAAYDGSPSAPIEFLSKARTTAASSNLTTTGVSTLGSNFATIVSIAAAVVGLALAGVSGKKLYDAVQNENSRENVGGSAIALVIGSILTIIGVVVGGVTYWATSN
ncbi:MULTISPECIES: hypothetical protein [unclassified Xanthobacter]|uniref:hypothetical protein n=1 Tax=unclassified Xanthobacter TaxID=2623496 RepID=UPI001F351B2F|nr:MULTISPECIES: hypothetical protein [unclassified Xanthobacter]